MDLQKKSTGKTVSPDPWDSLKAFTSARIALGRAGVAIPLGVLLDFKLAHAHARDAVYSALQVNSLAVALQQFQLPVLSAKSKAANRVIYLQRPDYGRQLDKTSTENLEAEKVNKPDVLIVVADGLSATAVNEHAIPVLEKLFPLLHKAKLSIGPLIIAEQARVAIADEIGAIFHAKLSVILIGERPGLSSLNSMGCYITYHPLPGLTDETRNCISNIHSAGLTYSTAAEKIFAFIQAALQLGFSGILLKEDMLRLPD